jgi:flagellar protein FliJ
MRSRDNMLRLHRFKHEERRRQVAEIEVMIADLLKKQDELDAHIRVEESRNGIADPTHYNYSTAAKASRVRRDNLLLSIGELKDQLEAAKSALTDEEAELKKIELLAERDGEAGVEVPASENAQQANYIR